MPLAELVDSYGYGAVFVGSLLEGETILLLAGIAARPIASVGHRDASNGRIGTYELTNEIIVFRVDGCLRKRAVPAKLRTALPPL